MGEAEGWFVRSLTGDDITSENLAIHDEEHT